ncbi:PREDICTED: F-box/LRR-repeat protein 17-like [Camelina sativa]|uniref:F-box/LRR-repeat protein 17-like n=1 Tax=Camelina sativa TaxID=90675 RepID=A0ABM0ZHZ7_CAMSA|nr:PREDICTED: F-box/LRR-repeat protein 17-like [Camelina sativa]
MQPQPHISPATATAAISAALESQRIRKNRGSYNCGRCGQPKKGHVCLLSPAPSDVPTTPIATEPVTSCISAAASSSRSTVLSLTAAPSSRQSFTHLRRALSFDDVDARSNSLDEPDLDAASTDLDLHLDTDIVQPGRFHAVGLWEVLKRLPPSSLLMAARVCKGWRETSRKMWKAAEELRIRVPERAQIGYIGSLLQKCPRLIRLSLKIESDFDATTLACIAFSCPNLEVLEISTSGAAVNRITGDELGRFVANKRGLTSLKMEGCSNLGGFSLSSSSLSTLWLSDLHSLSKMIFNCPNLTEISLEFSRQEDDSTDLVTLVDGLGRTCTRLQNIHIASLKLSHPVVLALTAVNFRMLRMLSLVLGIDITDASVAAISSSYTNLELLDLSGSSITDTGLGMICDVLPDTLSKLLVALCPNVTSSGIQFATAQLPLLELMDCGMTVSDPNLDNTIIEESPSPYKTSGYNQKMFIKHKRLKKLSLWGCSSLDALFLNCPELKDLNLNLCSNLQPESLVLQCPKLELVYASGCQDLLTGAIRKQVSENHAANENHMPRKRLADASKRIQALPSLYQETRDDEIYTGKRRKLEREVCTIIQ